MGWTRCCPACGPWFGSRVVTAVLVLQVAGDTLLIRVSQAGVPDADGRERGVEPGNVRPVRWTREAVDRPDPQDLLVVACVLGAGQWWRRTERNWALPSMPNGVTCCQWRRIPPAGGQVGVVCHMPGSDDAG